ncbi:alpha/beta fold hydrolase [Candidatus Kaiserbacteria bacterium]|nr:alpha/beta fold hydrolase [Candidatus Kaiserbacteria bacterium]
MPCRIVEITTQKKFELFGLWYGAKKPKKVFIFVHGLTSSVFGGVARNIMPALVDKKTAVLTFNNRGYGIVNRISGKKSLLAGAAHEVFTDSVDDIGGAVLFAKKSGAKEVYLVGHSTGCQKIVYYAAKVGKASKVNGLVLLAPVSDHAAALKEDKKGNLPKALKIARAMVKAGKKHELMPRGSLTKWSIDDAQRFLSLYSPDSAETIFPYEQSRKIPRTLRSLKVPSLVVWAGKDEYADRPAGKIAAWFAAHTPRGKVVVVPAVKHSFKGAEREVANSIRRWIDSKK